MATPDRARRYRRPRARTGRRTRRPGGGPRVRGVFGMGARAARPRAGARRLVRGRRIARRPAHPRPRGRCGAPCCGVRVATSRCPRTTRWIRVRRSTSATNVERCRRTKVSNASWSSPRTPTTSTSGARVRSRAGPTPASRWRTASAPMARRAASTQSVPRPTMAEIRQAEQRAAAKVVGVTDVTFLGYPDGRLSPEHRAAPRHQPGHPPGSSAARRRPVAGAQLPADLRQPSRSPRGG